MQEWLKKNVKKLYIGIAVCLFLLFVASALGTCDFPDKTYNVMNYGAAGNGRTDDTKSVQTAIDQCSSHGGGKVLFPGGKTFIIGEVELKSNVEFHVSANSTVKAIEKQEAYQNSAFNDNCAEGMKWLWAKDCENISITGMGCIDGSCMQFMGPMLEDSYELQVNNTSTFDPRPHVLTLENVYKLHVSDVTLTGAAYWTLHLIGCRDAEITGITIKNDLNVRNCDGIDIDHSNRVRISDCLIESGDDSICFKNRREFSEYGSCEDIVVSNCVMTSRSCAIKIGSENVDLINNITVDNCIIRDSNRGIGIQNRDEGSVQNVVFSNIIVDCRMHSEVWWGKSEPIYVTSYPRAVDSNRDAGWRFPEGATEGKCGEVKDIFFNNIYSTSENGCFIGGDTPDKVHDIYFNTLNIKLNKSTRFQTGVYDKRPCVGENLLYAKAYGIYVEQATNISVHNLIVNIDSSFPKDSYGGEKFGF